MPRAETSAPYRLFGLELSPHSVKVRAYLRFKGLPHTFVPRTIFRHPELAMRAKRPLVPVLVGADGKTLEDSTCILDELERRHPEPALEGADEGLAFLSAFVEEYADEWLVKPMYLSRWTHPSDADSASRRLAKEIFHAPDFLLPTVAGRIERRMKSRLASLGAEPENAAILEASLDRLSRRLDAHLAHRPYLLGARPCLGDFGLFGQLYELRGDPTGSERLHAIAPRVVAYVERMRHARVEGPFETWESLMPTLAPLVHDEVTSTFLPWSLANARAVAERAESFEVRLHDAPFRQAPQAYSAESLGLLRAKLDRAATSRSTLTILSRTDGMSLFELEPPKRRSTSDPENGF